MSAAVIQQPYRFTREEFFAFCATDPVRYERYELVLGQVREPEMESVRHVRVVQSIHAALLRDSEPGQEVFQSGSVNLDGDGHVFPDVYVLRPGAEPAGDYWNGHDLLVAVEVALSSWPDDSGPKRINYALGGVPTYYVVKLQDELRPVVYEWRLDADGEYGEAVVHDISHLLGV